MITSSKSIFLLVQPCLTLVLLFGCGDDPCPAGTTRVGAVCITAEPDAGMDAAGDDAAIGNCESSPPVSADEVCDRFDNDCDGNVDEEVSLRFFADADSDGVGDDERTCDACAVEDCDDDVAWVDNGGDCDETRDTVSPDEEEVCDGIDNDCDGRTDEDVLTAFYPDGDEDGVGAILGADEEPCFACEAAACEADGPVSMATGDCDDENGDAFPGNEEVCDGVDNNCDDATDEGLLIGVFVDADGDGFGIGAEAQVCPSEDGGAPEGFALMDGDCAPDDERGFPESSENSAMELTGDVPGGLRFDFNCDGTERQLFPACSSCTPTSAPSIGISMCRDSVRECGELGIFREYFGQFDIGSGERSCSFRGSPTAALYTCD